MRVADIDALAAIYDAIRMRKDKLAMRLFTALLDEAIALTESAEQRARRQAAGT